MSTSTSTTASWNEAHKSAFGRGAPLRRNRSTAVATEVFSPLKLKSRLSSPNRARGKAMAAGSPAAASRLITGPPG